MGTLAYFWLGSAGGFRLTHWVFQHLAALELPRLAVLPRWWNLGLTVTDLIAFSCVAFARFAFANEVRRRQPERDHLALQLAQLKSQAVVQNEVMQIF